MISLTARHAAREATLPQLHAAGIHPTVILDDGDGQSGNGAVGLRAVQHARSANTDWTLILEDDIDLAPDFPAFLTHAQSRDEAVTYFYLNDRPDRLKRLLGDAAAESILRREPQRRRLHPARSYGGLFGTQCVLIPNSLLPVIERSQARHLDAFDGNVMRAAMSVRTPVLIAIPHPVQHRHDRTGREPDDRAKRSLSYPLARTQTGGDVDQSMRAPHA